MKHLTIIIAMLLGLLAASSAEAQLIMNPPPAKKAAVKKTTTAKIPQVVFEIPAMRVPPPDTLRLVPLPTPAPEKKAGKLSRFFNKAKEKAEDTVEEAAKKKAKDLLKPPKLW